MVLDWALETRHRERYSRRKGHVRFGSKADICSAIVMSALAPKPDIDAYECPLSDIGARLLDRRLIHSLDLALRLAGDPPDKDVARVDPDVF